ncbi:MAG TPA: glycosyltransferase [Opitutaceae bacterium]|nr:glycosyltransferase [Opitutaceae bacterium]
MVLRFAHAYDSGGGTERYLDDVDAALLARNAMTIVRMHLTRNPSVQKTEMTIGRGRLVRIALPVHGSAVQGSGTNDESLAHRVKQQIRNWALYNPLVWSLVGAKITTRMKLPRRPGEAIGAGSAAAELLREGNVDLVVLHFFGGADADEIAGVAREAGVPIALLNHYSNDRFLHLAIRKHAMFADHVAGVNGLQLPAYLRGRFTNLSDGIDTDFFSPDRAQPLPEPPPQPLVLLPARVIREKGQLDLVRAAAILREQGIRCTIAFAGRVDASSYVTELRREISRATLDDSVLFLGGLTLEQLRDWYAASAVVAFPTYHHEGLGRVIVEAQAMGRPVVAYATGGVPDGIQSGRTGFLVRTGDTTGLAARIGELVNSPSLQDSMAQAGRNAAETNFSLEALAERHTRFYLQAIGPRHR